MRNNRTRNAPRGGAASDNAAGGGAPCTDTPRPPTGSSAAQAASPRFEVVRQLKDARKSQDITQETLAERVGTKKSNISRLESGRYNPSLDFLVKVADGLGKRLEIRVK